MHQALGVDPTQRMLERRNRQRDVLHLGDSVAGAAGDAVVDGEAIGVEAVGALAGLVRDGEVHHFPLADMVQFSHTDRVTTIAAHIVAVGEPLRLDPGAHTFAGFETAAAVPA